MNCHAEFCRNWTGHGCACEFLDLEPDLIQDEQAEDPWADSSHPPVPATRLGDDRVWVSWGTVFNEGDHPLLWHWCSRRGWGSGRPAWAAAGGKGHDLISRDPLTLSPSVYWPDCCGMHGFITDGQWRDA